MKRIFVLIMVFALLCGCAAEKPREKPLEEQPAAVNVNNIPEEKTEKLEALEEKIPENKITEDKNALEKLEATDLGQIQFLNDKTAYIYAVNRNDKTQEGFATVVSEYDTDTGEAETVFGGRDFMNNINELLVSEVALSNPWIYTGKEIFCKGRSGEEDILQTLYKDSFLTGIAFDVQSVYWAEDNKIMAKSIGRGEERMIYEYLEWENSRILSLDVSITGEHIVFMVDSGSDRATRYLMCVDRDGNVQYAKEFGSEFDYLHYEICWIRADKFAVFTSEPENKTVARIYGVYDQTEETIELDFSVYKMQNDMTKSYPCGVFCECVEDADFSYRLWRVNFEDGSVNELYTSPEGGFIKGFDLSPSGKTLAWTENDAVKIMKLE